MIPKKINNGTAGRTDPSKVKTGDLMAFVYYGQIRSISSQAGQAHLIVSDIDTGMEFNVIGSDLVQKSFSADQYKSEEKVTMTEMAEKLVESYNVPLTVVFTKANGEERTLRGRLVKPEPLLGRSKVEDLDLKDGNRFRLVDHRTMKELIVCGVKYTLKSK
jgi:hypothetical protein